MNHVYAVTVEETVCRGGCRFSEESMLAKWRTEHDSDFLPVFTSQALAEQYMLRFEGRVDYKVVRMPVFGDMD